MLSLKNSARIIGLKPEAVLGVLIVQSVFAAHGVDCVITSGIDGRHSRGSIHYSGGAIDFRTSGIPETVLAVILADCKKALGPDFDFIREADHFHMEFQPKSSY